jgi:trigger factor
VKKINEKFSKQKVEVKSEDVERELNFLANQRAKIVTVDREVKTGDQVELDFEAWKDNAPIEGGTAKKHQLVIGEGKFIPGFEDQLVGMKAGEKKDFDLAFPADYHQKNLAGQVTNFKVSIGLVQERELPELNDEFASGIGKFKNLKELKENLNKGMEEEEKKKIQQNQRVEVIEEVIKNVDVELPEILIESEVSRIQKELENDVAKMGLDRKQYIQQLGTTEEKLIEQWKQKEAPNRVKAALIMKKVSNDQKLAPSAKEVEERANVILQQYGAMQRGDVEKILIFKDFTIVSKQK